MQYKKVGEVFKIIKGKKETVSQKQTDPRYIQIDDLRNDKNIKHCLKTQKSIECKRTDLIIAWDGANAGTIGYSLTGIIGSTLAKLSSTSKEVFIPYIGRFLQSKFKDLQNNTTGATIPHISKNYLQNIQIPLPPLPIQQKIADALDKADAIKQHNKKILEKYDQLAQSVFLEMFGDPILNQKEWNQVNLEKLCKIRRGASPRPIKEFTGGNVPWIKIGDGTKGNDIYIENTNEKITEAGAKKSVYLHPGSVVFANCGVSLGFARILKIGGCIHDGWLSFENIDKNRLNKVYLLKAINSISKYFRDTAPDGTQPNLNTGIMKRFSLPLPPIELQNRFEKLVNGIEKNKTIQYNALYISEVLHQSLLQKSFKGELFN